MLVNLLFNQFTRTNTRLGRTITGASTRYNRYHAIATAAPPQPTTTTTTSNSQLPRVAHGPTEGLGSPGRASISVAPMVDVTDRFFLQLLRIASPAISIPDARNTTRERYAFYTEMQATRKIIRLAQERGIASIHEAIGPPCPRTVVQLGGSHPEEIADAYEILVDAQYAEVNLNLGCPSDSVQAGQFGAILMKSPQHVHTILRTVDAKRRSVPFTVKCRIGVDQLDSDIYFEQFINTLLENTSLDHVIVHARKAYLNGISPKQNRTIPPLNYERVYLLHRVIPKLHITINGGITTVEQVRQQLDRVNGVMIGREFRENPLFIQTLDKELFHVLDIPDRRDILDEYLKSVKPWLATMYRPTLALRPLHGLLNGCRGSKPFRRWIQSYIAACKRDRSNHMESYSIEKFHEAALQAYDEAIHSINMV